MSMIKIIPTEIEFVDSLPIQMQIHNITYDGYEFKSRGLNPFVYVSFIDSIFRGNYTGIAFNEKEYIQWVLGCNIGDILDEIVLYNILFYSSSKYIRKEIRPRDKFTDNFLCEKLPYLTRIG